MVGTVCKEYAELSVLMQPQNITPVLSKGYVFVIENVLSSAYYLLPIQHNSVITCNSSIVWQMSMHWDACKLKFIFSVLKHLRLMRIYCFFYKQPHLQIKCNNLLYIISDVCGNCILQYYEEDNDWILPISNNRDCPIICVC